MRRSLGELRDEIEEERGEIFFVTFGCSFGIKCHTVNVKGGGERRDRRCGSSGDNTSPWFLSSSFCFFPLLSLSLSTLSATCSGHRLLLLLLLLLLLFLMLFYACFLTATNILPPGQDLPPQYACRRVCLRARTHTSAPQPFTHTHKNRLPLNPCFKEITEASEKREGSEREKREHQLTDLSASLCPNYPISPLRVSRRKCTEGSRRQSLHVWKKANPLWIIHGYFVKSERYDACIWLRLHTVLLEIETVIF